MQLRSRTNVVWRALPCRWWVTLAEAWCLLSSVSCPDRLEGGRLGGVARQGQGVLDHAHQEPGHLHLPQLLPQLGRHADLLGEALEQHLRHLPVGNHQGLAAVLAALENGDLAGCAQVIYIEVDGSVPRDGPLLLVCIHSSCVGVSAARVRLFLSPPGSGVFCLPELPETQFLRL